MINPSMKPNICPPQRRNPLEVAYPTGKAISFERSIIVVKNGNKNRPTKDDTIYKAITDLDV